MLPRFDPLSAESSLSVSRLDPRLKMRLAHLHLEPQEKLLVRREEREF